MRERAAFGAVRILSLENFLGFDNTSRAMAERSNSNYVEQRVNTPRFDLTTEQS